MSQPLHTKFLSPLALLFLGLLLSLTGCMAATPPTNNGSTGAPPAGDTVSPLDLDGTEWILASYGSVGAPTVAMAEPPITLMFSNQGEIHGSAGCNTYFATYQVEGARFALSGVQHTEMACMDQTAQQQETNFLDALRTVTTATRDGEMLVLPYEGGELRFVPVPAPEPTALSGSQWELLFFNIDGTEQALAPGSMITAEFTDEEVVGSAGCNQYGAAYTLDGQNLTIEQAMMTQMACVDEGVMTQETTYLSALAAVTGYTLEGDGLVLEYQGGTLHFGRVKAAEDLALEGTPWVLTTFVKGEVASSLLADTTITVSFEGGTVNGTSGCNQYSGPYTLEGMVLKVGPLAATKIACPNDILEQESTFLTSMEAASSFAIEGTQLTIMYPEGTLIFSSEIPTQR